MKDHPEIVVLDGQKGGRANVWHSDVSISPKPPMGSVLYMKHSPAYGGDTMWADMTAAYETLDEATREHIAGLSAYHSLVYSQLKAGYKQKEKDSEYFGYGLDEEDPPLRPLVKIHAETRRPTLTIGLPS